MFYGTNFWAQDYLRFSVLVGKFSTAYEKRRGAQGQSQAVAGIRSLSQTFANSRRQSQARRQSQKAAGSRRLSHEVERSWQAVTGSRRLSQAVADDCRQ